MVRRATILFFLILLLAACVTSKPPKVTIDPAFSSLPEKKTLFVVPFFSIMVPPDVEEGIFDRFVDILNESDSPHRYEFVILKSGIEGVDPAWLAEQNYLTGEIFGYVEDTGCCNTMIRLKSRIRFYQPGQSDPTLAIEYPRETFFEHDYSTAAEEKKKLAEDVASTLATRFLNTLTEF